MHNLILSGALVASATLSMAMPAAQVGKHTFSVSQVPSGKVLKSGPISMLKTYKKFAKNGASAPPDVVRAADSASGQTGSVQANPEAYDQEYLCPVQLGDQTLNLDFDTGSADLWAFSVFMPSSQQSGHTLYDPSSSAQLEQGETWSISYGDGSGASGIVYADQVVVGGATATSQAVEAATSVSAQFQEDSQNDGLLGLAFSSINQVTPNQATTFFDTVRPTLQQQLFTADLKHDQAGTYNFGYIDDSLYSGTITYVNVDNSQGFWGFTAGGYSTGNSGTSGSIGSAIADTGTSLLYIPSSAAEAYYNQVSGAEYNNNQGGYTFPCSAYTPDFNVQIGEQVFTVPGSYMNYAPIDSNGNTCFGGIQANTGIGFSIFGDIFLKSVFAVFDLSTGSPQLGMAPQS